MNNRVIDDINNIDLQQWDDFVKNHPKGSVFQTAQMYRCYEQTPRQTPFIFAAYHNADLVGILLAVVIQEKGFLKKNFSMRCIIQSGPLAKDDDERILKALMETYEQSVGHHVIYTQIRNQFDQLSHCDLFRQAGFVYEPHLNYLITLDGEANIWSRIGKGRIKQIKKSQKTGLQVTAYKQDELTPELLLAGYDAIKDVYQRANLPLVDFSQMRAANNEGLLVMFVVRTQEGELAGCRFALSFGQTLFGWYAGSYSCYYQLYPNDILIWETLRWADSNGYNVFDYGGAGNPNEPYGVRAFKSQMGGKLVDFGRYEKIHHPVKMFIAKHGYTLYRKLFKF